jgi:hypothetical protein
MVMYNESSPRPNRISFYVFNPQGGKGVGSYFQEPVQAGEWIHVTGIADGQKQEASIYKNGVFKKRELSEHCGHPEPFFTDSVFLPERAISSFALSPHILRYTKKAVLCPNQCRH